MAQEIVCTTCRTDDHLSGSRRDDDLIELHCEACDVRFTRDPRPSCPTCGGFEMEAMPKVLLEKSRGSQLSIQGSNASSCAACVTTNGSTASATAISRAVSTAAMRSSRAAPSADRGDRHVRPLLSFP